MIAQLLSALAFLQKKGILLFGAVPLMLCCYCVSLYAQEAVLHKIYIPSQPLLTQPYQEIKEANLPITDVHAICQGRDETVWLSTQRDGLVAYTGNSIRRYRHDPKNKNSLPGNRILDVWEETSHLLWITTSDRIVLFNRLTNQFIRYPVNSRYVCKTPDGQLYTTVLGKGLYRIDTLHKTIYPVKGQTVVSAQGVNYPDEKMAFISQMAVDKEGALWVAGKTKSFDGLFHLDLATGHWIWHAPAALYIQSNKQAFRLDKETNPKKLQSETLHIDDEGNIWFGGWSYGLMYFQKNTGQWRQFCFLRDTRNVVYEENVILRITPLSADEFWIASSQHGFVFNHRKKQVYQFSYLQEKGAAASLRPGSLSSLTDHCGNRWLAGEPGVFKYHPGQNNFAMAGRGKLPVADGQLLTALFQLGPEHYLLGIGYPNANALNYHAEIQEIKKGKLLHRMAVSKDKDNYWPQQFLPAGNNSFYYFAQNLHRLNMKSGRLQTMQVSIKNEPTYRHEDYYNNILWNDSTLFSCRRTTANAGLVKLNLRTGSAFVYKNNSHELSDKLPQDNSLLRLMRDSYNRIWCATSGGIDIFYPDKEVFEHYSSVEGDSTSLLGLQPRFCEGPGRMFYIVSQSGVCATKAVPGTKAVFEHLAYIDGAWILVDKKGYLWIGTEKGVARINPSTKAYKIYSAKDGYKWDPMRKPHLLDNGFFVMHDGTVTDPAYITQNSFKPVPRISDFFVAGYPYALDTAIAWKQHIRLPHDENFFSFRYTCNNYINEEDNQYRYWLKGVDEDWVEAGTRTEAYYTALDPGIYQFYVQVANNDGIWSDVKELISITIVPAWYQTVWFKVAMALLAGLLFFIIYRQHILKERAKLKMIKQEAELKQQEAEVKQLKAEFEKQLAQTEMKALRSQMNPHFIFNCLNSIKLYTLQNNTEAASEYLSKFSRLIRLVLENSRMAAIPLDAELEYLRLYIDMEVMRFKQKLHYSIHIAEDVDTTFIEIPPLLLQPYVENAIWHGLMHKEEGGQIDISITVQESTTLVITITDNGIGRAKASELKSKGATARKSFGMKVTSERIALIKKLYQTETKITIQDLVDWEGQPAGTEVTIKIPIYDNPASHHRG